MPGRLEAHLRQLEQIVRLGGISAIYEAYRALGDLFDPEGVIDHRMGQLLSRRLLAAMDLRCEVEGAEHVADLDDYAIVCSHASYADWALLLGYFPAPVRFVAKKELRWVPIVGGWLRRRSVLIDRRAGQSAVGAIAAGARAEPGRPLLIFPEGTRSHDGRVQPFRKGGIAALASSGLKLVPVGLRGTHLALPRGQSYAERGRELGLAIGAPVDPASFGDDLDGLVRELEGRVRRLVEGRESPLPDNVTLLKSRTSSRGIS
jgi:1-acyl-sn-glycerol-3-phosphate acyltransferase